MGILDGQTVIILGGSGLIGRAVAQRVSQENAAVIVHYYRNEAAALRLVADIQRAGRRAEAFQAELGEEKSVRSLIRKAVLHFGAIHAVVDSAYGDFIPRPVVDMQWEDWEVHIKALQGHFLVCKAVIPYMREQKYGRIVYISGALSRRFFRGCSAYTAIKAGINGFCKTLALEEGAHHITVNIVAPGKVAPSDTSASTRPADMRDELGDHAASSIPLGRFATPEDVAEAVLYFISPTASGITGQTLFVAGGEFMP